MGDKTIVRRRKQNSLEREREKQLDGGKEMYLD
jgi:hypothetical protein